jgi:hypothetical protein
MPADFLLLLSISLDLTIVPAIPLGETINLGASSYFSASGDFFIFSVF